MTTTQTLTTTLRNGQVVLAKSYKGTTMPKTFANLTQANNAAEKTGGYVRAGYPFLVVVPAQAARCSP